MINTGGGGLRPSARAFDPGSIAMQDQNPDNWITHKEAAAMMRVSEVFAHARRRR